MINQKMQDAMNEQIREELESAYIYLSMSAYFSAEGWDGMAAWMQKQSQEEMGHAMKFYNHILERGGRAIVPGIKQPQKEWASPLAAFQAAYAHEQHITGTIHKLVKLATELNDYASNSLLTWFVDEQVEEEDSTSKVVQMLERIGDSGNGMYMLDHNLGARQ